nr:hypothetical protein [Tanacetum cinerariifolium]
KDEGIELVVDQAKDVDIAETEGRHAAEQAEIYHLDLDHPSKVLSMQEDDSEVQEVVEVVTTAKLITDVVTAASQVSAASATISTAKPSIPAAAPTVVAAYTRRRKGVIIKDPEEELSSKTPVETPKLKDKGKGTTTQNLAFVSSSNTDSTTESVSAAASVSVVCAKMHVSSLPNVDSLSNVVIYSFFASQYSGPQLDNEDLKQIDRTGRNLGANGPTSLGFDMSKVECYNCHKKGHFARECRSPKDSRRNGAPEPQRRNVPVETSTSNDLVSQCDGVESYEWSFQAEEEPANYTLMAFSSSSSSSDNEVSDSEDESETKTPQIVPSFVHSTKQVKSPRPSVQYVKTSIPVHTRKQASPKPTSPGKRRNKKACFVCKSLDHLIKDCDDHEKQMAQPTTRNHAHRGNHKQYAPLTHQNPQKQMVLAAVLTQSKLVSITAVRLVSAVVPKFKVTQPRHANLIFTKINSPTRIHITHSPSLKASNSPPRVTTIKALVVHTVQGNMSYLSDFEEPNYVAFGGNPKGGKIFRKGKIKTGKLDFHDVYFVKGVKVQYF